MSTDVFSTRGLKRRRRAWLAGLLVVAAAIGTSAWFLARPSVDELLRTSRAALARGATDEAQRLVGRALKRSPGSAQALLAAGEIELALDRPNEALTYFARVRNDG